MENNTETGNQAVGLSKVKVSELFSLLLTAEDKTALLSIIDSSTFKGGDVAYVSLLRDRILEAPLSNNEAVPTTEGDS